MASAAAAAVCHCLAEPQPFVGAYRVTQSRRPSTQLLQEREAPECSTARGQACHISRVQPTCRVERPQALLLVCTTQMTRGAAGDASEAESEAASGGESASQHRAISFLEAAWGSQDKRPSLDRVSICLVGLWICFSVCQLLLAGAKHEHLCTRQPIQGLCQLQAWGDIGPDQSHFHPRNGSIG